MIGESNSKLLYKELMITNRLLKRNSTCSKCDKEFKLGDICYSARLKGGNKHYYCRKCIGIIFYDPLEGMDEEQVREYEIKEDQELEDFFVLI